MNRAGSSAPAFDNGAASNTAATPERTCPQSVRLSEGMQSDKFTLVGEKKEKRLKNRTSSREPANYSSHENLFSHFPSTHRQVRRPPDDRLRGPLLVRAGELQGPKPPRDLRLPPRRRRHRLQGGRIRRHGGADLPGGRTQRGGLHGHPALQSMYKLHPRSHNSIFVFFGRAEFYFFHVLCLTRKIKNSPSFYIPDRPPAMALRLEPRGGRLPQVLRHLPPQGSGLKNRFRWRSESKDGSKKFCKRKCMCFFVIIYLQSASDLILSENSGREGIPHLRRMLTMGS